LSPFNFGKHIIPASLQNYNVFAYIFQGVLGGYRNRGGVFRSKPGSDRSGAGVRFFFDHINRIYTQQRHLPASKVSGTQVQPAIIADGSIIYRCAHRPGGDRDSEHDRKRHHDPQLGPDGGGLLPGRSLGAEAGRSVEGAIIDKNTRIGEEVVITPENKPANADGENYYIRDGVVVVPKGTVIPAGTLI
jgi:glucose-1-phosphate adenylyltransferase